MKWVRGRKWAESKDMRRWACSRLLGFSSLPCSQHFPLLFYNMNNFLRSPFHSNRCHFREKCTSKLFNLRKGASRIHRSPVVVFVVSVSSLSLMTMHLYLVLCVRVSLWVCESVSVCECICVSAHLRSLLIWFTFHFRLPYAASHTNSAKEAAFSCISTQKENL